MKKLLLPAMLLAVLVGACVRAPESLPSPGPTATAAPSPTPAPSLEPTPHPRTLQATWLEVDDSHRFWVELKETDEPSPITENPVLGWSGGYIGLRVNFCKSEVLDVFPEQSFLEGYNCEPYQLSFFAEDWNFDGYTDLAFTNMAAGFRYHTFAFYFWDPETEQFVRDPYGLGELNNPWRDSETQTIGSFETAAGGSEWYGYYRFQNGELLPLRKCSYAIDWDDTGLFIATVEDFTDGVGQIVFYAEDNGSNEVYEEYNRWRENLNYHG